jgi:hypothetical protein
VPSKGLAIASLVCGIVPLAKAAAGIAVGMARGSIFPFLESDGWALVFSLSGNVISIVFPLLAVIFSAVTLNQGKGTDWAGKVIAKAGFVTAVFSVAFTLCWFSAAGVLFGAVLFLQL